MERDPWHYMGKSTFLKINQIHVPLFNRHNGIHKIEKYRKNSFLKKKRKTVKLLRKNKKNMLLKKSNFRHSRMRKVKQNKGEGRQS